MRQQRQHPFVRSMGLGVLAAIALAVGALGFATSRPVVMYSSNVEVENSTSIGSGVYVADGLVITAGHMVVDDNGVPDPAMTVEFEYQGRPTAPVHGYMLWYDKATDVAALRVDNVPRHIQKATIANEGLSIGDAVDVVGTPLGITFIYTHGTVSGVERPYGQWQSLQPLNVEAGPGNSGGPVYKAGTHEVAGILIAGHDGVIALMVPAPVVYRLLVSHLEM
jgi:S1-C subfamily serine protease